GRPHRADAGRHPGAQRRRELRPGPGRVPPEAPPAARRLSDPRRRPEPYLRGDGGLLRGVPGLVAAPTDPGAGLVAGPGGAADPRLRGPLPEAQLVAQPGGVYRASRGLLARVQRAVRSPVRVDVDQPEDEAVVRETSRLNSLRYFVPGTLGAGNSRVPS